MQSLKPNLTRKFFAPLRTLAIVLATTAVFASSHTLANDTNAKIRMFDKLPTVDELTDIIFPTQYRSVVLNSGASTAPAPEPATVGFLINFKYDSTHVMPESIGYLETVGKMMTQPGFESEALVIEGHTDATGPNAYNQNLSERRALAVRNYLSQTYGIDAARFQIVGKGEMEPFDANNPADGINRRVQFRAVQ